MPQTQVGSLSPFGERVGVRGLDFPMVRNPSPGSLRDPTSPYGRGEERPRLDYASTLSKVIGRSRTRLPVA
jgi:hypothetical protein